MQVRDECLETTRSLAVQHYKLAVVGGMGSGRVRFAHQVSALGSWSLCARVPDHNRIVSRGAFSIR
jgi:hypothetical protein